MSLSISYENNTAYFSCYCFHTEQSREAHRAISLLLKRGLPFAYQCHNGTHEIFTQTNLFHLDPSLCSTFTLWDGTVSE